jgi:mRNA interferase HigB
MRIIAKRTLRDFWQLNPTAEQPLLDWYDVVSTQAWHSPNDVKQTFASASIINSNRVVFNIKGNDFRLVCHIDYVFQLVFVIWVGRHADYDKLDVKTIAFKRKTE